MNESRLSPHHVLPVGTQVVLKRDLPVSGPRTADGPRPYKKRGNVGFVREAPVSNDYRYLVEFADGSTTRARRTDLTVRRDDSPIEGGPDRTVAEYECYVIFSTIVGSRAYGLSEDDSDTDERGVYLPPAEWTWSLHAAPEQIEFKRLADGTVVDHHELEHSEDVCWWELGKFLRLALKANPNVLEVLYADDGLTRCCDDLGRELRSIRDAFLSQHLYKTYSGYVLSQFKRMRKAVEGGRPFRAKHAMHLIRLLHSGIAAVRGHGIMVDVGEHRDELLEIKRGEIGFEHIHRRALELDREFQEAFETSPLPTRPDVDRVDAFLVAARRARVRG